MTDHSSKTDPDSAPCDGAAQDEIKTAPSADTSEPADQGQATAEVGDASAIDEPPPSDGSLDKEALRLEALERELAEAKDLHLRSVAEVENVRKRSRRDVEKAHKSAARDFARKLVPLADNVDHTLAAMDQLSEAESKTPFMEGLRLTIKGFTDAFEQAGLRAFSPKGERFDPNVHEAVSMFPVADAEPNTIYDVVRCGYYRGEDLVRAAQVVVVQAPPEAPED